MSSSLPQVMTGTRESREESGLHTTLNVELALALFSVLALVHLKSVPDGTGLKILLTCASGDDNSIDCIISIFSLEELHP